ncbi:MAG: zinc metallopeptidase [Ruminococcus sp.]|jgi:Zn-dependent membrane protease YugP|nr:zinc metallopeptidase [Ruminococcus sp.]
MGYFSYLYYYDWSYLIFMLPLIIFTLVIQGIMNSTFRKYSAIRNSRGITGAQAAERVLMQNGVTGVRIEPVQGSFTDHFDPRTNVIRLSEPVYNSNSIAAVGVACHEAGHAVQHAQGYLPNKIRSVILPAANIGSKLSWIFIIAGLITSALQPLLYVGIILFSAAVLFTLATLPVEFNASSRALKCIKETAMLSESEYTGAKRTLQAAAMTYVASAATAVAQLLRLILIAGRRND